MTNFNIGRWLLVVLAIVGLAFAAPVVSAHDTNTTADDAPPYNGTTDDWATWMESHMGVTVDEMAQDMADNDYEGGMYGQGHC